MTKRIMEEEQKINELSNTRILSNITKKSLIKNLDTRKQCAYIFKMLKEK